MTLFAIAIEDAIGNFAPKELLSQTLSEIKAILKTEPRENLKEEHEEICQKLKNGKIIFVETADIKTEELAKLIGEHND